MTINIKNFLKDNSKLSKMGEFQNLKQICANVILYTVKIDNFRKNLIAIFLASSCVSSFASSCALTLGFKDSLGL